MITISKMHLDQASLQVTWDDQLVTRYPWIWLRDHAHDEGTIHPVTQQRQLFTAAMPSDLVATAAEITDDTIDLSWSDDSPNSVLPVAFLARYRTPAMPRVVADADVTLWDAHFIKSHVPLVG